MNNVKTTNNVLCYDAVDLVLSAPIITKIESGSFHPALPYILNNANKIPGTMQNLLVMFMSKIVSEFFQYLNKTQKKTPVTGLIVQYTLVLVLRWIGLF